jgi:hypothetical protein
VHVHPGAKTLMRKHIALATLLAATFMSAPAFAQEVPENQEAERPRPERVFDGGERAPSSNGGERAAGERPNREFREVAQPEPVRMEMPQPQFQAPQVEAPQPQFQAPVVEAPQRDFRDPPVSVIQNGGNEGGWRGRAQPETASPIPVPIAPSEPANDGRGRGGWGGGGQSGGNGGGWNGGGGSNGGNGGGEWRGNRGGDGGVGIGTPGFPGRIETPRPQPQPPIVQVDPRRGDGWRGNDGRGFDGRGNDGRGNDGRGVWGQGGQGDQGGWRGGDGRRDNDGRRDSDGRREGWNHRDNRGWGGSWGYNNGRNDSWRNDAWRNNGRGYGYNNNQNWNRSWRFDRRYDWQSYRSYNRDYFRQPRYYAPYGYNYGYRRFSLGVYLGSAFFTQRYWIDDPYDYRLPNAYPPYRWVRYYNDVLLVDTRSGYVVDAIYDFFW